MVDSYHNVCLDKREIIFEELNACERLLKYVTDYNINNEIDKKYIESEIAYFKIILDNPLIHTHYTVIDINILPKYQIKGKISEKHTEWLLKCWLKVCIVSQAFRYYPQILVGMVINNKFDITRLNFVNRFF